MAERKRICFVTGTRADFGLLAPLMAAVGKTDDMETRIVAAAAHLVPAFGNTKQEIRTSGFTIDREVDLLLASDTPGAIARSTGLGLFGFASAFEDLEPGLIIVLGDRFEALAGAAAGALMGIPVAHLHGGENTLGSVDESLRHAITKLSRLHFTAAEPYRQRVIQMGEAPDTVFNVGALGLEAIDACPAMTRAEVAQKVGLDLNAPVLLITFHPPTAEAEGTRGIESLLGALGTMSDARLIFTGVNADAGHEAIRHRIAEFVAARPNNAALVPSLGHALYVNAMRHADVVVGNSSSGVIEAPYLRRPSVDIGQRQEGRLKARSVLSCPEEQQAIRRAIEQAMSNEFNRSLTGMELCYEGGPVSQRVVAAIRGSLHRLGSMKPFYDLQS